MLIFVKFDIIPIIITVMRVPSPELFGRVMRVSVPSPRHILEKTVMQVTSPELFFLNIKKVMRVTSPEPFLSALSLGMNDQSFFFSLD